MSDDLEVFSDPVLLNPDRLRTHLDAFNVPYPAGADKEELQAIYKSELSPLAGNKAALQKKKSQGSSSSSASTKSPKRAGASSSVQIPDYILNYSDSDLVQALTKLGVKHGPINDTTRKLYQQRLYVALKDADHLDDSVSAAQAATPEKVKKIPSRERDESPARVSPARAKVATRIVSASSTSATTTTSNTVASSSYSQKKNEDNDSQDDNGGSAAATTPSSASSAPAVQEKPVQKVTSDSEGDNGEDEAAQKLGFTQILLIFVLLSLAGLGLAFALGFIPLSVFPPEVVTRFESASVTVQGLALSAKNAVNAIFNPVKAPATTTTPAPATTTTTAATTTAATTAKPTAAPTTAAPTTAAPTTTAAPKTTTAAPTTAAPTTAAPTTTTTPKPTTAAPTTTAAPKTTEAPVKQN